MKLSERFDRRYQQTPATAPQAPVTGPQQQVASPQTPVDGTPTVAPVERRAVPREGTAVQPELETLRTGDTPATLSPARIELIAWGAWLWSGVPTHAASICPRSLCSISRQSSYKCASGYFAFTRSSRFESTSATQTSFTFGCEAMPSRVENAIPLAPKAASRRVPEGGFDSISRTINGAAMAALPALVRKDRRSVITR